jgi:hypothetical protein
MSDNNSSMSDDDRRTEELTQAILGYLAEHPGAMDTLEGIAGWWLLRQQVRTEVLRVAHVLDRLTSSGVLEEIGTGNTCRYRLRTDTQGPGKHVGDGPG